MEEKIFSMLETLIINQEKMTNQIDLIHRELDTVGKRMDFIEKRMDSMEKEVLSVKEQVKENTAILKALEHSASVNKAEHDKMMNDLAELTGEVKSIRKDLYLVEAVTSRNWNEIAILKAVK